ncbi:MAG: DUF1592 domain-containing protein [Polyangiaceae bacterium]
MTEPRRLVSSRALVFALALVSGCTGEIGGEPMQSNGGVNNGANGGATNNATSGASSGPQGGNGSNASAGGSGSSAGATQGANGGATSGAGATATAGNSSGTATTLNLAGTPQYYRVVRLTNAQWAQSVQDILKLTSPSGLEQNFQSPVAGTTDFTNNELVLRVDERATGDYRTAAETLATQLTASSSALARIYSGTDGAGFIGALGRRAYRRPLTSDESAAYLTLFNSGANLSGTATAFVKGAGLVIRAMLQSPNFLYRTELGDAGAPLTAYEMGAKLSLWLRGTSPSDALLDSAAGSGKLDSADGAAALATTMLDEQAVTTVMRRFHNELLHFDRYSTVSKIGVSGWDAALNTEFQESSYRFFDKVFSSGLGVQAILTSTSGFVGAKMAGLYGVTAPSSGYEERDLGANRVGYFSQIPFLTLYGLNGDPDSIHRGVSMNLDVLCAVLGPPATELPPIPALQAGQTNRQRISTLTAGCGGTCHNEQINPIGFSFEHFDGMGRYRDTENGNLTIDSSGSFTVTEGTKSFSNAADLMKILAASKQSHLCYSKKMASFGLQRDIVSSDMPLLDALAKASLDSGSAKRLILELVRNDAFRVRSRGNQ